MSLDSLPPEIHRLIVEATVPSSYRSATYDDRQQTLYNLCLVSRQFRQFARPLLFEIVGITSEDVLQQLLESLSAKDRPGAGVKRIICISSTALPEWLDPSALDKVSTVCPAVSALTITVFGTRDLSLEPLSSF